MSKRHSAAGIAKRGRRRDATSAKTTRKSSPRNDPSCGDARWHFIGRLQRNKAKLVAGQVALVHAVDSAELAIELGSAASAVQPVLIAVNLGGETTKGGVTGDDAPPSQPQSQRPRTSGSTGS